MALRYEDALRWSLQRYIQMLKLSFADLCQAICASADLVFWIVPQRRFVYTKFRVNANLLFRQHKLDRIGDSTSATAS